MNKIIGYMLQAEKSGKFLDFESNDAQYPIENDIGHIFKNIHSAFTNSRIPYVLTNFGKCKVIPVYLDKPLRFAKMKVDKLTLNKESAFKKGDIVKVLIQPENDDLVLIQHYNASSMNHERYWVNKSEIEIL